MARQIMPSRRLVLYGVASLTVVALVYGGFVYPKTVEAEPLTLLEIARLHLGLAQVIPEVDKTGKKLPFRGEHLDKAQEALDRAERSAPGLAITREFRAFKCWIEEDFDGAARWYREVLRNSAITEAATTKTLVNLAQVEVCAQRPDRAMRELEKVATGDRNSAWYFTRSQIHQSRRDAESRKADLCKAVELLEKGEQELLRVIANQSFDWGDDIALSCYEQLVHKDPLAWYRIARLKLAAGDTDSGLNALETAREKAPKLVADLMQQDAAFWQPYHDKGTMKRDRVETDATAQPGK